MRTLALLIAVSLSLLLCGAAVCQGPPPPPPPPPLPADAVDSNSQPADIVDSTPEPPAVDLDTGTTRTPAPGAPAPVPTPPAPAPVKAPSPQPAPAPVAAPWLLQRTTPFVIVGPSAPQAAPKPVTGEVSIVTKLANNVKVASVSVLVDGKSVGTAVPDKMGLYGMMFNTASLTAGVHKVESIGADSTGKQVWAASTTIDVRNKQAAAPAPAMVASVPKPVKPTPVANVTPASPAKVVKPANAKPLVTAKPAPAVMLGALSKTYASSKYGFSIKHPAGWIAKDKTTAMKPKQAGNGWIEFSAPKNAGLLVNVRRMRLEPSTTASVFAKYNPYVTKWDRKTVLNAEAFATNTDTGNKIIHRLIIVKDRLAWMLNCVDGAGKTSDAGQKLFDSMVASFSVSTKQATKPAPKPARVVVKVAPKPIAKPIVKSTPRPMVKPAAKPVAMPVAKPITKPAAKTGPKTMPMPAAKH